VRRAGVEERNDVRMRELRRDADLAHEALGAEHRGERRVEQLECDAPIVTDIARDEDGRHGASADLSLYDVASGEGGVELGEQVHAANGEVTKILPRALAPGQLVQPRAGCAGWGRSVVSVSHCFARSHVTSELRDALQQSLGTAYTVERELGGGGMSRVFVATDTRLGRRVVVKVLSPDLVASVSAERFEREIRLA